MTNSQIILNVATRESELSVTQTEQLLVYLKGIIPAIDYNVKKFTTTGDRNQKKDLRDSEDNFFTKDIDDAVIAGVVDFGIHSAKDCPYPAPSGLDWFWAPIFEDQRDVIVARKNTHLADLPENPVIGVSSDRREKFSVKRFPNGRIKSIRGDIKSRISQLDGGAYDVIIIALAAIKRLGIEDRITEIIPLNELMPPDAQGKLCISFRKNDKHFIELRKLFNPPVIFASAGIGSIGNLTIAVKDALKECEVCLYDSLINPKIFDYIHCDATLINVGKRNNSHPHPQESITNLIAYYARTNQKVVRLKGGDSTIFGRLDEEINLLENLQIPYRILAGISSFQSISASNGLLLTKRGENQGFTVFTAVNKDKKIVDIAKLKPYDLPLVIYMGIKAIRKLIANLLTNEDISKAMPVAIIFGADSIDEIIVIGTVENIVDKVKEVKTSLPGLIVIGQCVTNIGRNKYNILSNHKVLLTGSKAITTKAKREIVRYGGMAIELPLIKQIPCLQLKNIFKKIEDESWLIITSPSAARILISQMKTEKIDFRKIPHLAVCGSQTENEFIKSGIYPEIVPKDKFSAEELKKEILNVIPKNVKIFRLRSDLATTDLSDFLRQNKYKVNDCVLYNTKSVVVSELPKFDSVFFASNSAVVTFINNFGVEKLEDKLVIAIGKPTQRTLNKAGIKNIITSHKATSKDSIFNLARHLVGGKINNNNK